MRGVRVAYVCKAVDEANPVLANQVRWIRSLATRPSVERVRVVTQRQGTAALPANVAVRAITEGRPLSPARLVAGFYRLLPWAARGADLFFVAQGGPYPALLLPWRLFARRGVYQWKAMPHVSARMRFYVRCCDDLVFTATPGSFPMHHDKVRSVGHGIDTELFHPRPSRPERDLVMVTRVAPVKRLEHAVRAVAECGRLSGFTPTLDVVGPCDSKSRSYREAVLALVSDLGLEGTVRILPAVAQDDLPALLSRYRATLNFSETAFDKAAGEAMASGLPVIATNPRVAEMLPPELAAQLVVDGEDVGAQAAGIAEVLSWDDVRRAAIGERLRAVIVEQHGLDTLFDKIFAEIETDLATRRRSQRSGRRQETISSSERMR